ncbi:MAG: ribosomal protein S18-alanine N-acetyltransferase [Labilithrix sp.]|nr:ribosomal protein S18-alanine N-acetyltransferase [Labilithrix sp.]MBX3223858.1 ribosomal protein S18-alanine N-acetyltransferase [Labilithrix sp.]
MLAAVQSAGTTIEPMTEADLDAALAIDLASFHPGDIGGERDDPRASREKHLREELARSWARLRVARGRAGEVLGYILFWLVADEIHLLNVAVAPDARRRGIGRALVEDLIAFARANAAAKVLLEVRASNHAAIQLYERLGFTRFNIRRAYYGDGEDGVEMMLELAAA